MKSQAEIEEAVERLTNFPPKPEFVAMKMALEWALGLRHEGTLILERALEEDTKETSLAA